MRTAADMGGANVAQEAGQGRRTSIGMQGVTRSERATVRVGPAVRLWDQIVGAGGGNTGTDGSVLWLLVDDTWRRYDAPPLETRLMTHLAVGLDGHEIIVWYDGPTVVGLAVLGTA